MSIATSVVFAIGFAVVAGFTAKPFKRVLDKLVEAKILSIRSNIESRNREIEGLRSELEKYKELNFQLRDRVDRIILDAEDYCKTLKDQVEIDLENQMNEKLENTLKRISNYSSVILQELRESSVDIALSTMKRVLSKQSQDDPHGLGAVADLSSDMRKKFH